MCLTSRPNTATIQQFIYLLFWIDNSVLCRYNSSIHNRNRYLRFIIYQ
uniref:ORF47c n=1 Tax=Pinus koraiensis TaxID=88728 RepID=A4QMI5_PINKO|nr:ORF47c [Pinus koraiensis]ABP35304.1 ORF47c [Pinus koraiensis]